MPNTSNTPATGKLDTKARITPSKMSFAKYYSRVYLSEIDGFVNVYCYEHFAASCLVGNLREADAHAGR